MRRFSFITLCMIGLLVPEAASADLNNQFVKAFAHHNTTLAGKLLDKGANPNLCDKDGYTVLMDAVIENNVPMTKLLLKHGANVNAKSHKGETAGDLAESYETRPTIL